MRLPKDRKDRALFGVLGVVGIATASFLGTTFLTPNFSIAFGPEAAAADFSAAAQPVYHAQIAHGPVPLAQVAVKMAKGEGPVDIDRSTGKARGPFTDVTPVLPVARHDSRAGDQHSRDTATGRNG